MICFPVIKIHVHVIVNNISLHFYFFSPLLFLSPSPSLLSSFSSSPSVSAWAHEEALKRLEEGQESEQEGELGTE